MSTSRARRFLPLFFARTSTRGASLFRTLEVLPVIRIAASSLGSTLFHVEPRLTVPLPATKEAARCVKSCATRPGIPMELCLLSGSHGQFGV